MLGAIGVTLAQDDLPVAVAACFLALTGSFLVSYTRARAEGLGVTSNKGGLMSRPERIVLTAAGLFFAPVQPRAGGDGLRAGRPHRADRGPATRARAAGPSPRSPAPSPDKEKSSP